MDHEHLEASRLLIEFAREVEYNDARYAPKELHEAATKLEEYLDR